MSGTIPKTNGYYIAAVRDEKFGEMLRAVEVRDGKVIAPDGERLRAEDCRHFHLAHARDVAIYWPQKKGHK